MPSLEEIVGFHLIQRRVDYISVSLSEPRTIVGKQVMSKIDDFDFDAVIDNLFVNLLAFREINPKKIFHFKKIIFYVMAEAFV